MYDPTIGQFLSEDPISFEGLDVNLRRYVANQPLIATDPDGRTILFTGDLADAAQVNKWLRDLKALKNESISQIIKDMEESKHVFVFKIVRGDDNTTFGSFNRSTIDLDDFDKLPDDGVYSKTSVFYHELVEQWEKHKTGKTREFQECHQTAMEAESLIHGFTREREDFVDNPDGTRTYVLRYRKGRITAMVIIGHEYPNGKVLNVEIDTQTWTK